VGAPRSSPPLWADLQWRPALPPAKAAAAGRMVFGRAVKCIAAFDTAFWEAGPCKLGSCKAGPCCSGPCGSAVPTGTPQRSPELEAGLNELGPVMNLFPSSLAGRPALVGLITGERGAAFARLPPARQRAAVLAQYERYFRTQLHDATCGDEAESGTWHKGSSGSMAGGAVAGHGSGGGGRCGQGCGAGCARAARCVWWACKDWGPESEPFSRGCYAAVSPPGLPLLRDEAGGGWQAAPALLRAPVWGRVFFAGTETADSWCGYFEGALQAGHRAAGEAAAALAADGGPRARL
jgi:monoamine oxidase